MSIENDIIEAAEFFKMKNADYGDGYKTAGQIMKILFPNGIVLKTAEEMNLYFHIGHVISCLIRISTLVDNKGNCNFEKVDDTAKDMGIYSFILKGLLKEWSKCQMK